MLFNRALDNPEDARIPEGTTCRGNKFDRPSSNRIIGGVEAKPYSWNWIVHFAHKGCGGSIINRVRTADLKLFIRKVPDRSCNQI